MLGDHALSLTAVDGVRLVRALEPTHVIPVQYAGWARFTEDKAGVEAAIRAGTFDVRWLPLGVPTDLDTGVPETKETA